MTLDECGRAHLSWLRVWFSPEKGSPGESDTDLMYACRTDTTVLSSEIVGGDLVMSWAPVLPATAYWIYGASNQVLFSPSSSTGYQYRLAVLSPLTLTWSSPSVVGDPTDNWTYLVLAVDGSEQELCRSNRVGEWDFRTTLND